jgi:hypothetical protein
MGTDYQQGGYDKFPPTCIILLSTQEVTRPSFSGTIGVQISPSKWRQWPLCLILSLQVPSSSADRCPLRQPSIIPHACLETSCLVTRSSHGQNSLEVQYVLVQQSILLIETKDWFRKFVWTLEYRKENNWVMTKLIFHSVSSSGKITRS